MVIVAVGRRCITLLLIEVRRALIAMLAPNAPRLCSFRFFHPLLGSAEGGAEEYALNLRTLSVGQAPSQSWYSGLHSLAPCVGHLWKMNYYRASSTELSFAQGAATATAPAILLPLDPMPTQPHDFPFSQDSGARLDLQARSSTMRRWSVAEEAGIT